MWFWFTPVGLNNYVNKITLQLTFDSPQILSQLGFIDNTPFDFHSGKLDDYTKAHEERSLDAAAQGPRRPRPLRPRRPRRQGTRHLEGHGVVPRRPDPPGRVRARRATASTRSRAPTVSTPQFLTDTHVIKNERSVERYLSRLAEFGRVLREIKVRVEDDRAHGVVPPDFVIDQALTGMRAFIDGGAAKNALVTTLPAKLAKIEWLDDGAAQGLRQRAPRTIVAREVIPGYEAMIALFESMRPTATHDAGIWRIPEGEEYYATRSSRARRRR